MSMHWAAELDARHDISRDSDGHVSSPPGEVIVVGAGAFGAAAALELRSRGWTVTLVDRSSGPHPDASSTDISKMVRMDYGSDDFYQRLAEHAIEGWERWNGMWSHPHYHEEGFLILARDAMRPGGFFPHRDFAFRAIGQVHARVGN